MQQYDVNFLDAHGPVVWNAQMDVGVGKELGDLASTLSGQGDDRHFAIVRRFDRPDNVGRVPASGNGNQNVSWLTQGSDLTFKDGIKAIVVADGRKNGGVGVQGYAGQGQAIAFKAADEFSDKVLGVGGGAAIAAGQDFAVVGQGDRKSTRLNSSH